ncbi:MAG: hypothetical protein MZW92_55245 [Comamonadaceae bacterium]|nr:hypothetical protein [Comamonadaceae bacterium]
MPALPACGQPALDRAPARATTSAGPYFFITFTLPAEMRPLALGPSAHRV